jgi:hypothetical protein
MTPTDIYTHSTKACTAESIHDAPVDSTQQCMFESDSTIANAGALNQESHVAPTYLQIQMCRVAATKGNLNSTRYFGLVCAHVCCLCMCVCMLGSDDNLDIKI